MFDDVRLGYEFFAALERVDEEIARLVAAEGCDACDGPLHQGNYERKPRGGLIAPGGETSATRYSLCCGREGCRKRSLPPSVRFLGRRVYVGAVVIVASIVAMASATASEIKRSTGVPARTTRRWLSWWRGPFVTTEAFVTVCARLVGVAVDELPASVVLRLGGSSVQQVRAMLTLLAPITTVSVHDGSRFVRGIV